MTDREKALQQLRAWHKARDVEVAHGAADEVLCRLLISLGYRDVVEAWEEVPKWYA